MLDKGSDEEFVVNSDEDNCAPFSQQCNSYSYSDLKSSIYKFIQLINTQLTPYRIIFTYKSKIICKLIH